MNKKAVFILFFLFIGISTSSLFSLSIFLRKEISKLSSDIFMNLLVKEADVLVAVTRNDFISGNTKMAKSYLEKALNPSGISKIEIYTEDTLVDSVGSLSNEENFYYTFDKSISFSTLNEGVYWGSLKFYVSKKKSDFLSDKVFHFQLLIVIPLFIFLIFIFAIIFYLIINSSVFLHSFFKLDDRSPRKLNFLEKYLWKDIIIKILKLKKIHLKTEKLKSELKIQNLFSEVSKQVAHDIRSPLSALNMVVSTFKDEVAEDKRFLIKNSVQRINDIANDLLQKSKSTKNNINREIRSVSIESKSDFLLSELVDSIVSEKRIQYRDKINIKIDINLKYGFGIFVFVNAIDLSRVISNLINNSVESLLDETGDVIINVFEDKKNAIIEVKDNGKGIPQHILEKLGLPGVSHGKSDIGNGIGVYHAIKTIESCGGNLNIFSTVNLGTDIRIALPRIKSPIWFASFINIKENTTVVSVDDDLSIHDIWKKRFSTLDFSMKNISLISFTSVVSFSEFTILEDMVFLIDYNFLNQNLNGLDLIKNKKLYGRTTLVTSHFDNLQLKEECEKLNIKILPKSLSGFVPLLIC